ncbi:MAG: hypothetical protein COB96_03575 [Planctomycetota bacterium]|nr:MAG: hypothetical protein COB96_03575 [Planctomycetota bacterium]
MQTLLTSLILLSLSCTQVGAQEAQELPNQRGSTLEAATITLGNTPWELVIKAQTPSFYIQYLDKATRYISDREGTAMHQVQLHHLNATRIELIGRSRFISLFGQETKAIGDWDGLSQIAKIADAWIEDFRAFQVQLDAFTIEIVKWRKNSYPTSQSDE